MNPNHRRERIILLSSFFLCIVLLSISVCVGSFPLSLSDIVSIIQGNPPNDLASRVFFQLRIPRTVTGFLVGAVLGLTGGIYQSIFKSPLASPDLTGIASGASFGAACAIVIGSGQTVLRMGSSFLFGMLSLAFVLLIVRIAGGERTGTYILAGILVSSVADAGLMILKIMADPTGELAAIEYWLMGSLSAITLEKTVPIVLITVPSIVLLLLFYRPITMLSLDSDTARGLGLSPNLWRFVLLFLSTLAISSVVSVAGVVGFAGLIAPHIAYFLYGRRSGGYFPLCTLIGGNLLLIADLLARSFSKGVELPLSIFTILFAVPVLGILLIRNKGGR